MQRPVCEMRVTLPSHWALVFLMAGPCLTLVPERESCTSAAPQVDLKLATEYLQHYYNLRKEPMARMKRSSPSFASKMRDMQTFFGLNVTGELDSGTLEVMRSPRCGVPDAEEYSHIQRSRWDKNVITYRIGRYTRDLPRHTVDSLVGSAFGVWAGASGLTFVRSRSRNADIMVEFVTNAHGDFYPFDGPRGTLAHAFAPGSGVGGDTHFDDDERWTAGDTGFNLFVVAAHEFGHALGLKHSRNPESLMYPTYRSSRRANLLSREDVATVHALYSPVGRPPKDFLRSSGSSQFNRWASLVLGIMDNKCDPDPTLDAVSVMEDATVSSRQKNDDQNDIREGSIVNLKAKIETSMDATWVPRRSSAYPKVEQSQSGFIHLFVGPQVHKYDSTLKRVVGVETADSWLGCRDPAQK